MEAFQGMQRPAHQSLLLKINSLRMRAGLLNKLRKTLSLTKEQDIAPEQWDAIESQLSAVSNRIRHQLRLNADKYFSERNDLKSRQTLVNLLGELELQLTEAFGFYDTYMDILSQRLNTEIGVLLKGCDVIARHALRRGFLEEISIYPMVYCTGGFGARILKEGVNVARDIPNPVPFIGIPYSRMSEKYNLISIFHEVGHQALVKLNMLALWQKVLKQALLQAGASPLIANLYANWSRELIPDFWAFCLSGMAQTCSIRDVLVLPAQMMFNISPVQPHPPSYLRFLVSTEWCRQLWGAGDWDDWEKEWLELYPLDQLDAVSMQIITESKKYLPVVCRTILRTRFKKLDNRPLASLFDLKILDPQALKSMANVASVTSEIFQKQPIGVQLGAFRLMREKQSIKQVDLEQLMNTWLKNLKND